MQTQLFKNEKRKYSTLKNNIHFLKVKNVKAEIKLNYWKHSLGAVRWRRFYSRTPDRNLSLYGGSLFSMYSGFSILTNIMKLNMEARRRARTNKSAKNFE